MRAVLRILSVACATLGVSVGSAAAQCSLPHTLANGQPADSAQIMANFNALVTCLGTVSPAGSANSVQYNAGAGAFGGVAPLTDGQLVVGSTGNPPQARNLVAGTGVTIGNQPGAITVTSSTSGLGLYRQTMSALPTGVSTGLTAWYNQAGATASDTPVGLTIDAPSTGNNNVIHALIAAAPAPPYTVTALVAVTRSTAGTSYGVGIGWFNGVSNLHTISLNTNQTGAQPYYPFISVPRWQGWGGIVGTDYSTPVNAYAQPIWFRIQDDGTNVSFAFSQDGATYLQVFSTAKSSGWLGANGYTYLTLAMDSRGSRTLATLLSWKVN